MKSITASDIKLVAKHRILGSEIERLRTFMKQQGVDPTKTKDPSDQDTARKAVQVLESLKFFFSNLEKFKNLYFKKLKDFNIHKEKVGISDFESVANYRRRLVSLMRLLLPHFEAFLAYLESGMDSVEKLNSMLEELKKIEKEQLDLEKSGFSPWDKDQVLEQDKEILAASLGTVDDIQIVAKQIVEEFSELHKLTY